MGGFKRRVRIAFEKVGFELTRYPHRESLRWHLRELINYLDITCVLDVGANVGQYGSLLRHLGYRGRIISFEPVRDSYRLLETNTSSDPNWTIVPIGLGSKNEQVTINVTRDSKLSSILLPDAEAVNWKFNSSLAVDHTEEITVARLDSIFDKYIQGVDYARVFLKTDTQGWDLEVLRGAERSIDKILAVQFEASVHHLYPAVAGWEELIAAYVGRGFYLTGLFPQALDLDLRVIDMDCLMCRVVSTSSGPPTVAISSLTQTDHTTSRGRLNGRSQP